MVVTRVNTRRPELVYTRYSMKFRVERNVSVNYRKLFRKLPEVVLTSPSSFVLESVVGFLASIRRLRDVRISTLTGLTY